MTNKYHVITRCTRQENLQTIFDSIFNNWHDITWHVIFDCLTLKNIDADIIYKISNKKVKFYYVSSDGIDYLYPQCNKVIDEIKDGYIIFIDDDNVVHPDYFNEISKEISDEYKIYVVDQYIGGKDFTGLETRIASKENNKVKGVDIGQITFHYSVFKKYRFKQGYQADGILIEEIMVNNQEWFKYVNKTLSYYNYIIAREKNNYLPRILLIGREKVELTTKNLGETVENKLNVLWKLNDEDINKTLCEYKPDSILLVSDDYTKYEKLCNQPLNVRNKWITIDKIDENSGQISYDLAMNNILDNDNKKLISYFTSVYNCGVKIYALYDNLTKQTYKNWEWVIVNDSTDGGHTQKYLDKMMTWDPRVKIYEFNQKTQGIIGEAKYRAATLCNGELLVELDHDDKLIENCGEVLMNAAEMYQDAGFFYSDTLEINEKEESIIYPQGFACGYGQYRKIKYQEKFYDVAYTPNINPKTIRHIVGVPNHVRAWRKSTYHNLGGHNRNLANSDDYELIIRTFLNTKMVKIPTPLYIQKIHENNSHDKARKDIQRRVRSIMYYYNDIINKRFEELGVEDWAYNENKYDPLSVPSRYGDQENYVNYIYQIN